MAERGIKMERLNQLVEWLVAAPAAAAKWFIDLSTVRWSRRAKLVVTGAVLMNAFVGLAANWWVKTGGILEDPITDEHNPLVVENRRASAPFWGTDTVVFWLDRQGLTDEDAIAVYRDMHWQLYEKLPWAQEGLLSLISMPYLRVVDGGLVTNTYMAEGLTPTEVLTNLQNEDIERVLVSHDRSRWGIMIILPHGYSQSDLYWGWTEIVEERSVGWFERRFWKYHIEPSQKYQRWDPSGWPLPREAIERGLIKQTFFNCGVGVLIVSIIFALSAQSLRFAVLSCLFTFISIIWVHGGIALIDLFTTFRLRPYIIIADANTLVQGLSYFLLTSFVIRAKDEEERTVLLGAGAFNLIMGICSFGSLWWSFEVRAIREMAALSGVGLVQAYFLSQLALPVLVGSIPPKEEREANPYIDWLQKKVARVATHQHPNFSRWALGLMLAAGVASAPFLKLGSQPLDFIVGHTLHDSFTRLQDDSQGEGRRVATDGIPQRVAPAQGDLNQPEFWWAVDEYTSRLNADPGTIVVAGVGRTFFRLMSELYGHHLPETPNEVAEVLAYIRLGLSTLPGVLHSLLTEQEIQLILLQRRTATSQENLQTMEVIAMVAAQFSSLFVVERGGASALYGEVDRLIWVDRLENIGTQIGSNAIWFLLLGVTGLRWYQRRHIPLLEFSVWRLMAVMSVPFLFATAGMTVVMTVGGVRLDQANAAILACANNASSDFVIYFATFFLLMAMRTGQIETARHETARLKGEQVVEDVTINMICFATLLISRYLTIRQMGWMIPAMLGMCGFGALVIMPPFLPWTVKRVDGQEPERPS